MFAASGERGQNPSRRARMAWLRLATLRSPAAPAAIGRPGGLVPSQVRILPLALDLFLLERERPQREREPECPLLRAMPSHLTSFSWKEKDLNEKENQNGRLAAF